MVVRKEVRRGCGLPWYLCGEDEAVEQFACRALIGSSDAVPQADQRRAEGERCCARLAIECNAPKVVVVAGVFVDVDGKQRGSRACGRGEVQLVDRMRSWESKSSLGLGAELGISCALLGHSTLR